MFNAPTDMLFLYKTNNEVKRCDELMIDLYCFDEMHNCVRVAYDVIHTDE